MSAAESGWYPDPADPDSLRWWTGAEWTLYTLPSFAISFPVLAAPVPVPAPESDPVPVPEIVDVSEPELPPLLPDGPIRVAPPVPERRRRAPAVPRQAAPAAPAAAVVDGLPKQVQPEALATSSSATLGPGPESAPAQPRGRWRRTK